MGGQLFGLTQEIVDQAQVGLQISSYLYYVRSVNMSLSLCHRICSTGKFKYMGVMNGEWCGCGNYLEKDYNVADQNLCNKPCGVSATDKCCGIGSFEGVYKIQYTSKLII